MSNRYIPTLSYTEIDRSQIVKRVEDRLRADGFGNLLDSKKISLLVDIFGEMTDFVIYYLERRAEENYYDSARLEATAPLLANNYGYTMRRPIPAKAPLSIKLRGQAGTPNITGYTIAFPIYSRMDYNGVPFLFDRTYIYTVTADDDFSDPDWSKTFTFAAKDSQGRFVLKTDDDLSSYKSSERFIITLTQGEFREVTIDHLSNPISGQIFQRYTIDDPEFSNYFGKEDPNAYSASTGELNLAAAFTKVSVTFPDGNVSPFMENSLYTIDRRSLITHDTIYRDTWDKFYDENGDLIEENIPKTCVMRTDRDGGVNLIFGDGLVTAYPGSTHDIHIRYLATRGSKGNKIGVSGEQSNFADPIYASGSTGVLPVTTLVQALIAGNISGGSDLESLDSVRMNAPSVFNSFDRLIGLSDYVGFLRQQATPIVIRHAIAWGENEEAKSANMKAIRRFSNHVFFSAVGSLYYKRDDGSFAPKDHIPTPTTDDEQTLAFQNGTYLEAFDFDVLSASSFFNALVADRAVEAEQEERILYEQFFNRTVGPYTEQQVEMVERFAEGHPVMQMKVALDKRAQLTVHHQYISPIIQQFYLDGDVVIRDFADLSVVRSRLDSKIYEYLDNSVNFCTPLYISQLVDIIKSDPDVSYCNIRFTPIASNGEMITDWVREPEFNSDIVFQHTALFVEPKPVATNKLTIVPNASGYFTPDGSIRVGNLNELVGKVVRVSTDNGNSWKYTEITAVARTQTTDVRPVYGFLTTYRSHTKTFEFEGETYNMDDFQRGGTYIVAAPYEADPTKIGQYYTNTEYCLVNGPCYGPDIYEQPAEGAIAKMYENGYWRYNGTTWVQIAELPSIYTITIDTTKIGSLDTTKSSTMVEIATNFDEICDSLGFTPKFYLVEGFRTAIRNEVQRLFDVVMCKQCDCTSPDATSFGNVPTTVTYWNGKCVPLSAASDYMPRTETDAGPCRQVQEKLDWFTSYGYYYLRRYKSSDFERWTHCNELSVYTSDELLSGMGNSGLDIAEFSKIVAARYPWMDGAPKTEWKTDVKIHHRIGGITERWFWTGLARLIIIELRRIANYRNGHISPDFYTTDRKILDLFLSEYSKGAGFSLNAIRGKVDALLASEVYIEDFSAITNTENFISSRSFRSLLKKLHNGMVESIRNGMLDADGNIVNYSLRNEIAQVRSRITVRYRGGV